MTRADKQNALGSENFGRSDQQHDNERERNGSGRKTSWSLGSTIFFSIFFLVIGYGIERLELQSSFLILEQNFDFAFDFA